MSNLAIATLDTFRKNVMNDDKHGLVVVRSEKTGNSRVGVMKKKEFTDRYKKANPDATNKKAAQAFEQYRVAALRDASIKVGTMMVSGSLMLDSLKADGTGDLRTINLVKRDRAQQDRVRQSLEETARLTGLSIEQLVTMAKAHSPDAAIEIEAATPKPEEASKPEGSAPEGNAAPQGEQAPAPQSETPAQQNATPPQGDVVNPPQNVAAA